LPKPLFAFLERFLRALAFSNVANHGESIVPFKPHQLHIDLYGECRPVLPAVSTLKHREARAVDVGGNCRGSRLIDCGVDIKDAKREKLFATVAKRSVRALVAVEEAQRLRINHFNRVAGLID